MVEIFLISLICVWTDIHTRKIPNEYLLYAAILGITFQPTKFEKEELIGYIFKFLIMIFLLFPMYVFKVLGAGDIKLAAVWSMKLGVKNGLQGILLALYVGAVIGLVALVVSRDKKVKIPFSPAILIGMLAADILN